MAEAIGISFGTSACCVGVWRNGYVEIIANDLGNRTTPCCVAFNDHEQLAGEAAWAQIAQNSANSVFDLKTLLGRKFSDHVIQENIKKWPFKVKEGSNDSIIVEVTFKGKVTTFTPEQLTGFMLAEARSLASSFLSKGEVKDVVIGVPHTFPQPQRDALLRAASSVGLNVLRLLSESCASVIAYGLDQKEQGKGTQLIGVLNFGAAFLDATLLRVQDGLISVLSSASDTRLGGYEVDNRLVDAMLLQFTRKTKTKIEGKSSERAMLRLRTACQSAKKNLSSIAQTTIGIDSLFDGKDMEEEVTRARFDTFTVDLLQGAVEPLKLVLKQTGIEANQLDQIYLVGGSSRIPKFKQIIANFVGPNVQLVDSMTPEEVVASGCSIQASLLGHHKNSPALNQPIPIPISSVTLGLSLAGGLVVPLVPRGTPLPCSRKIVVLNQKDNQASMKVSVLQGERLRPSDNRPVTELTLKDLPKGVRGSVKVEVEFNVSLEGDLTVTATELASKKSVEAKASKGEEKQAPAPTADQLEADRILREQVEQWVAARRYAGSVRAKLKDKSLKDENGAILTTLTHLLKWIAEIEGSNQFPTIAQTTAKRRELETKVNPEKQADVQEEDDEEEGDEGDEDAPAVAPSDEDLD
jgi:L1 cell adhesion molecule like protein